MSYSATVHVMQLHQHLVVAVQAPAMTCIFWHIQARNYVVLSYADVLHKGLNYCASDSLILTRDAGTNGCPSQQGH